MAIGGIGGLVLFLYQSAQAVDVPDSAVCPSPICPGSGLKFNMPGILTPQQIAQLAMNAQFSGNNLPIAIAIALAESSGNPNAYNPELAASGGTPQGQGSYGLWQIYLKKHPEFQDINLYDPQSNANAAFEVSKFGSDFTPWATYTNRKYTAYMSVANQAVLALNTPDSTTVASDPGPVCTVCQSGTEPD